MRSLARRIALILLTGGALCQGGSAWATLVRSVTLPELVRKSATIVHGTVQETRTAWEDGRARLYTYVTVSPLEVLKGNSSAGRTLTFRQLGGQDGDQVILVPGTPRFSPKQEVLLFLTLEDQAGYPHVTGIYQGAFRPVDGPGGARGIEAFSPGASSLLLPEKARGPAETPPASVPATSFGDFLERIRSLARERAGGSSR